MATDSPDLVIAKRLLDLVKAEGFQFQRVAEGPDGALLGIRQTDEGTDTLYLEGFSQGCYAMRERKASLVVPGHVPVECRATGSALNVLNSVLTWGQL